MHFSGRGGGGLLVYVVIAGFVIILGTSLGCSRIFGIFLDCSQILDTIFLVKFSLLRNHSDF